jgi:transcriptional regulator with XRE-family HTH domain
MALRELRQARNRTQVSMAKRLGVKQVSISRLESREDPRLSTLTKYIDAMGGNCI